MNPADHSPSHRPAAWALLLAFLLVYLSWGTTYLAIKRGVKDEQLPPALFGGVRVCLAGALLLGYVALRGGRLRLDRRDLAGVVVGGLLLFVGGNGLITLAEKTVPSGVAAVLAATTPLWIALLEMLWPRGERLSGRGWLGLGIGLGGVLVLLAPKLNEPGDFLSDAGPFLVLGSAASWALGALVLRHWRVRASHLAGAGYQMFLGGGSLALLGLVLGETNALPATITAGAAASFVYLLIVGSLVGFVAFNWLLGHVSAARAGTYAYVNPVVAVLVGCLLDGEELTGWILGGITIILAGVALVRTSRVFSLRVGVTTGKPASERPAQQPGGTGIDSSWYDPYGKIHRKSWQFNSPRNRQLDDGGCHGKHPPDPLSRERGT
jgi:drug/metabolite transporter (DMT)-like permease